MEIHIRPACTATSLAMGGALDLEATGQGTRPLDEMGADAEAGGRW
jgi:hypothetical protein